MKKIKLPLEMANGVQVRTLDELKENWDLEKVLNYYLNGKLQTWLMDRYYTELADELAALSGTSDNTELQRKLCSIFGIENKEELVDVEAVAERNRRLAILRQYTADDEILKNIDNVAFNQEEMADLLDEGNSKIYLFNNRFSIPLAISDKTYIGIGDVVAVINSKEYVDFAKLHISFDNICFNKEYEELVTTSDKVLYQRAEELENAKNYKAAFECYLKAAKLNNGQAYFKVGYFYENGLSVEQDYEKALQNYLKAAEIGNTDAMNNIAVVYANGIGIEKNMEKALEWYKKSAEAGNTFACKNIGDIYYFGNDVKVDYEEAIKWFEKANDNPYSFNMLGKMYEFGQGVEINVDKAMEFYKKAMTGGYYNENYLNDPTYRYTYKLFHKYNNHKQAVDIMNNYYNKDKIKNFVESIYKDVNKLDFPYSFLKTWKISPSGLELIDGSSKTDALAKLQAKIDSRMNEGFVDCKNSMQDALNEYIENINILIRKTSFVKYLIMDEELKIDFNPNEIINTIKNALNNVRIPKAYAEEYRVDAEPYNQGSFFNPRYSYTFIYDGDQYRFPNIFIDNLKEYVNPINEKIKNVFILEMNKIIKNFKS